MTLKEFASLIKVNAQSVYNMIDTGANLPPLHRRAGSTRILFYKPQVYEWMTNGKNFVCVAPASQVSRPTEAHA